MAESSREVLKRVFGFDSFRGDQEKIIECVTSGRDAFVLMPTGGGKSLCYQIPALMREGCAIVVSPLISLMKDQVDALTSNGVKAAFYNSSLDYARSREVMNALCNGKLDLLYVAPERLVTDTFMSKLKNINVSLFAIDEAHCVSQWGHDFRPEYTQIQSVREKFADVPVIALTATADAQTRQDIVDKLGLSEAQQFISSFDRPNIAYWIEQKSNAFRQLCHFLKQHQNQPGIVYCFSRAGCEKIAQKLVEIGYKAEAYHAGLPDKVRKRVQEEFIRDEIQIVAATIAFGMGIDKPNVRFVVHYDLPRNLEGYYQETGRAGRDGFPAEALLLFSESDVVKISRQIQENPIVARRQIEKSKLASMQQYAESGQCRRKKLLGYFGEHHPGDCGNCDNCLRPKERSDATEDAILALMCIYDSGQKYSARTISGVLCGEEERKELRALKQFGKGTEKPRKYWDKLLAELRSENIIQVADEKYATVKLTKESRGILREGKRFSMQALETSATRRERRQRRADSIIENYDTALFEKLRAFRSKVATEENVPAFVVFGDRTLIELASVKPKSISEMCYISGIGTHKLKLYGEKLLTLLWGDS